MTLTEDQILELAHIFDDIITSESSAVQSSFQRLALLSSLAKQEREEPGPFVQLFNRLEWLERELVDLRRDIQIVSNGGSIQPQENDVVVINPQFTMNQNSYGIHHGTGNITIGPITPLTADSLSIVDLSTITLTLDK